ncbi:MAG: hypothetical protein H7233_10420 [Pseudorhodobacter sp.]|nr:hypothetical protein [Frankiaceae bacterium]
MPSRALAALFLTATAGLVVVVGLALSTLGVVPVVCWAAVSGAALGMGLRRARGLRATQQQPTGRTCTCCTTTVHDPVTVT